MKVHDNNNNGIVATSDEYNFSYEFDSSSDIWPPPNGQWDEGEYYEDWGQDGIANTNDLGEGNGLNPIDSNFETSTCSSKAFIS